MGLTGLSQLPPSVRAWLGPGEEPLAWQTVDLAYGESRIGRTGRRRIVRRVNLNPVRAVRDGLVEWDEGFVERRLGGVSLTGAPGSLADRLGRALADAGIVKLLVTSERIVVVTEGTTTFGEDPTTGRKTWDAPTEQLWSAPRSSVRSARLRPRPLMAGRLLLDLDDGSSIALMCGLVLPGAARRLRAALSR